LFDLYPGQTDDQRIPGGIHINIYTLISGGFCYDFHDRLMEYKLGAIFVLHAGLYHALYLKPPSAQKHHHTTATFAKQRVHTDLGQTPQIVGGPEQ